MFRGACDQGVAVGCVMAADVLHRPGEVGMDHRPGNIEVDHAEAARLYESACRLGTTWACARAASMHLSYIFFDILRDIQAAKKAQRKAIELVTAPCEKGDGESCTVLAEALIYRNLPEDQLDFVEARRLVKKACEASWPKACAYHADLMLRGLGGDRNVTDGVATFERTCAREVPKEGDEVSEYACAALAYLHAGRDGILPKTPEAARRFARRACELYSKRVSTPCPVEPEVEEMLGGVAP